jgi:hypothetical protein
MACSLTLERINDVSWNVSYQKLRHNLMIANDSTVTSDRT